MVADNTNVDIYLMGPDGSGMRDLTVANAGADNTPRFSPDGKWLSYLSMARAGFEADRLRLMLVPRSAGRTDGAPVEATAGWSLSVGSYSWCADSKCLYAVVEERGRENLYRISLPGFQRTLLFGGNGVNTNLTVSADGKTRAFLNQSNTRPAEVFANDKPLTHTNDEVLAHLDLHPLEAYGYLGAGGDSVFGWLLKPPGFDATKKYPVIYLVHGGPQGAWDDNWHARWNYQMFASRGYVVAAVNFHGSTGYGQAFTDAISQHWGDWPYEDVMKGLDVAGPPSLRGLHPHGRGRRLVRRLHGVLAGRPHRPVQGAGEPRRSVQPRVHVRDHRRAVVPQVGIRRNPISGSGGNRALYEQWSPLNFVQNWKTPMLIVHSQLDYRVDLSEGVSGLYGPAAPQHPRQIPLLS